MEATGQSLLVPSGSTHEQRKTTSPKEYISKSVELTMQNILKNISEISKETKNTSSTEKQISTEI